MGALLLGGSVLLQIGTGHIQCILWYRYRIGMNCCARKSTSVSSCAGRLRLRQYRTVCVQTLGAPAICSCACTDDKLTRESALLATRGDEVGDVLLQLIAYSTHDEGQLLQCVVGMQALPKDAGALIANALALAKPEVLKMLVPRKSSRERRGSCVTQARSP